MGLRSILLTVGLMLALDAKATIDSDAERQCLALTAFTEARDQGEKGMALVMHTVLTRSANMGKTICQVAYQRNQYHGVLFWPKGRTPKGPMWEVAIDLTHRIGKYDFGECLGATHFYAPKVVTAIPRWAGRLTFKCQYKGHRFYGK